MSSVYSMDYPCPQCNLRFAWHDYDLGTRETSTTCGICGYEYFSKPMIDRKRVAKNPAAGIFFKMTKAGQVQFYSRERIGLGSYRLGNQTYSFDRPQTPQLIEQLATWMQASDEFDTKTSYLAVWNEQTEQLDFLLGTPPVWDEDEEEKESIQAVQASDDSVWEDINPPIPF